jgi:hypothetical protein
MAIQPELVSKCSHDPATALGEEAMTHLPQVPAGVA